MRATGGTIMLFCFLLVAACRPSPSVEEVRRAVSAHFEARGYAVLEISVKNITPLATREKTYMGVPTFVVVLDRLVLQVERKERVFRFVRLKLKAASSPGLQYTVSDISGVALP